MMDWREYVKAYLRDMKSQLFTTLPAEVLDVSEFESTQTITVRPSINRLDSDGAISVCPIIYNVPVVLPSAGGGILSFPVQVGDTVMVQFSMRNIESWLEGTGEAVSAPTRRLHDETDGIAVVGLTPKSKNLQPSPEDVELKFKGNKIILRKNGDVEIETASKFAVRNQSEELVNLISETLQTISEITTNTTYGITPINNKPDFISLKSRWDTFLLS